MNLKSLTQPELAAILKELGQPAFRAKQLFSWLHKGVRSYDEMKNIPKSLRTELAEKYIGLMITAETHPDNPELHGCVLVTEELAMILQAIMDKFTFQGVDHSWTKLCYYYKHIGA